MPRFTPEEAQLGVELFGSQRAFAQAVGCSRTTIRYCLNPEQIRRRQRERCRERYAMDSDYRERQLERRRKWYAENPEYERRYRSAPENRSRRRKWERNRHRERYANDPDYRERKLKRNRERYWSDPLVREMQTLSSTKSKHQRRRKELFGD